MSGGVRQWRRRPFTKWPPRRPLPRVELEIENGVTDATVAFLTVTAAMGLGNGAIFALVGRRAPAAQVGSVTGLVGAAGRLGGFMPPILMAFVLQVTGSYAIGLMLLSNVAFAGAIYTAWRLRPA